MTNDFKRTVPIKFRGVDIETGEYRYGCLVIHGPFEGKPGIIDSEDYYRAVKPDSVAQLVDYDADGREVYEGDDLYLDYPEDNFHKEYKAVFRREALAADGCFHAIGKVRLK